MKQTFTTSDGIRLAYYIDDYTDPWKTPPTLLMLHSAMSSAKRFYSMVPGLAKHYRVIRLDSRGHGESEVPPPHVPHDKWRLNKDVIELLDTLGHRQYAYRRRVRRRLHRAAPGDPSPGTREEPASC